MLPVQEAVKKSVKTFADLYPSETYRDLRLEEVGISEDERTWQVTLSYQESGLPRGRPNAGRSHEEPAADGWMGGPVFQALQDRDIERLRRLVPEREECPLKL